MNNHEKIQQILKQFGERIALEALELNDDGSCRIIFDSHLEVNLELDDVTDSLLLISPVVKADEELFADALELNLFWGQLHGCRFILLRNANVLALMRRLSIKELELSAFEETLEMFLETVTVWRKAFEDSPHEKEKAAACGWNVQSFVGRA
jgi:hypothetical protein